MERSIAEKIAEERRNETPKKNAGSKVKAVEQPAPEVGSGVPFDMSGMPERGSRRKRSKDRYSLPPMSLTPPPERAPNYFSKTR